MIVSDDSLVNEARKQTARQKHPEYISALHDCPCQKCGEKHPIHAAHIRLINLDWAQITGVPTGAGMGHKPWDCWALPLCASCHLSGPKAEHAVGTRAFYRDVWPVNPHEIAWGLYRAFVDHGKQAMIDHSNWLLLNQMMKGISR